MQQLPQQQLHKQPQEQQQQQEQEQKQQQQEDLSYTVTTDPSVSPPSRPLPPPPSYLQLISELIRVYPHKQPLDQCARLTLFTQGVLSNGDSTTSKVYGLLGSIWGEGREQQQLSKTGHALGHQEVPGGGGGWGGGGQQKGKRGLVEGVQGAECEGGEKGFLGASSWPLGGAWGGGMGGRQREEGLRGRLARGGV